MNSEDFYHSTETQESFDLRRLHWQEESLMKVKILKVTLHKAAGPTLQAAIKPELSYQKDTIIAFFFAANTNNGNAKAGLAFSKS